MAVTMRGVMTKTAAAPAEKKAAGTGLRGFDNACRVLLVTLAVTHNFVFTIIGLQDLGGANMYSNLRMQVPVSDLSQLYAGPSSEKKRFGHARHLYDPRGFTPSSSNSSCVTVCACGRDRNT
eukprot:1692601-Rhodomonas_salina.2